MHRTGIRRAVELLALATVILLPACRRNTALELKTPAQRVAVYNGVLAESVHAATEAAISLEGAGVLTRAQALRVLDYTGRAASASNAVALIQQKPGDWTVLAPQIRTALNNISPPGELATWLTASPAQSKELSACLDAVQSAVAILVAEVSK